MANPSLQIGNGKFAIKENDLLGYSSSGTRFFPIPITMTRATLGSRVNPSGLVEDVELLGSELVTNGDFATDLSGWTNSNNHWQWTSQGAYFPETTTHNPLTQILVNDANDILKFTFTLNIVTGTANAVYTKADSSTVQTQYTTSGTYTIYTVPVKANTTINFSRYGGINTEFYVDNVSVKEATIDGLARVDYTDGTASLLVEPQRTNLVTYSEDFSQSYWTKTGTTEESGFVSPDGTDNAFSLIEDTSTGLHFVKPPNSSFASNIYTLSVFAKYNGRILQIASTSTGGHYANFDLLNGVIGNSGGSTANVTITEISNGWYRCSMTTTSNMNTAIFNTVQSATSVYQETYTGNGTSGIYIFGAQAEAASFPTSYIPTSGSAVTRNQDIFTRDGIGSLINDSEGTLFVEMAALANDGTFRNISLNDGTTGQAVRIYYRNQANKITVLIGSSSGASVTIDVTDTLSFNKIAISYKVNDVRVFVNGSLEGTITSVAMPVGLNELALDIANVLPFYGKVKQLQVFKTALTDTELATLTTI